MAATNRRAKTATAFLENSDVKSTRKSHSNSDSHRHHYEAQRFQKTFNTATSSDNDPFDLSAARRSEFSRPTSASFRATTSSGPRPSSKPIVNVRPVNDTNARHYSRPSTAQYTPRRYPDIGEQKETSSTAAPLKTSARAHKTAASDQFFQEETHFTPCAHVRKGALQKEDPLTSRTYEAGDLETINLTTELDRRGTKGINSPLPRSNQARDKWKGNAADDYEALDGTDSSSETSEQSPVSPEEGSGGNGDGSGDPPVSARRYISVESLVLEDNFDATYSKNKTSLYDEGGAVENLPQVKLVWNTPPSGSPRSSAVRETEAALDLPPEPGRDGILDFFTRTGDDGVEREGRHDDVDAYISKFYTRCLDENGTVVKSIHLQTVMENLDEFVLQPAAVGYDVQCRVTRDRRGVDRGLYPTYYMHLERPDGRKVLLLTGRKRKKSTTSNYLISTDAADLSRDSAHFIGKVRSNLLGTQFLIYDNGESHKRFGHFQSYGAKTPAAREELAAVIYEPNVLGFKGPRKMKILIPEMKNEARRREHRPEKEKDSVLELYKQGDAHDFFELKNKAPIWNNENQSFVLNFHGRVTQASVKNFQIIHELKEDYVILQFGRVAADLFTMDFRYPLCPLQAFAIVLTSFDNKLACE